MPSLSQKIEIVRIRQTLKEEQGRKEGRKGEEEDEDEYEMVKLSNSEKLCHVITSESWICLMRN